MQLKRKTYGRKGRCFGCNVSTGSKHNINCDFAFTGMPDAKRNAKKLSLKDKVRILFS